MVRYTLDQLTSLLRWAQSGEIVLIVTTPGIGKTKTAERFEANDPNVWLATMAPSTAGVVTMLIEIAAAIGLGEVKAVRSNCRARSGNRCAARKG
jgi:DNA transposition AAA+ family ATPase